MRIYKIVSFSVVIFLISVLFAGVVAVPAAAQYDTMQDGYDAAHTGDYSAVAGNKIPAGRLLWNSSTTNNMLSSPVVANGVVYTIAGDANRTNLHAFDAKTGAELWKSATGEQARWLTWPSPAVVNGVVYVCGGTVEHSNLYAFDAKTGAELWHYWIWENYCDTSPTVADGAVYLRTVNYNSTYSVNYNSTYYLYAVNATTGKELWNNTAGKVGERESSSSSPAVANGVVYVLGNRTALYAFNATTSLKLWNSSQSTGRSIPSVVNGAVYIASENNNLYALNATTGAELWSHSYGNHYAPATNSVAIANGVVYTYFQKDLYAVNATTGTQLWNYTAYSSVTGRAMWWSSPAVANGVVYATTTSVSQNLYTLDATTGAKLWNYTTTVHALDATTGAKLWNYTTTVPTPNFSERSSSHPLIAIASGVVYFSDGLRLYAIGSTGASQDTGSAKQVVIPGFEAILVCIGVLIAAYVARSKR